MTNTAVHTRHKIIPTYVFSATKFPFCFLLIPLKVA